MENVIVEVKTMTIIVVKLDEKKMSSSRSKFLQRRYGVSLGRRYVLAATSVVLMGVLGYSQINSSTSNVTQSRLPNSEAPPSSPVANPEQKIVAANTRFSFKLFSEILKEQQEENIFISPSSIAMALAMTYNGASGSTQKVMAQALELKGLTLQQVNTAYGELKNLLINPDTKVKLNIANSLWADKNAKFNPEFLQRNQNFYQAKVTNLNFKDPTAPQTINRWVKEKTQGKIDQIVGQINSDEVLLLLNAIYFKGSWSKEFDRTKTQDSAFNLTSGEQKIHPMMSQNGKYKYYETEQFQSVSLPYGEDGRISCYVFLPKENSSLKTFYQNLNAQNWEKWMTQFQSREGLIRLPRFKTEYDITLNKALSALGMGEAFTNRANFSGMGNNLAISEVKHKTFVEVNEEGTEAAATTSVGITQISAAMEPAPFKMIVNRPFFYAIRDNKTGSLLFMGSIVEPRV